MIENIQIEYVDNVSPSPEIEADAIKSANAIFYDFAERLNEGKTTIHILISGDRNYRYHFSNISDDLFHLISKRTDLG
jgi:hypothetical protein